MEGAKISAAIGRIGGRGGWRLERWKRRVEGRWNGRDKETVVGEGKEKWRAEVRERKKGRREESKLIRSEEKMEGGEKGG